LTRGRIRRRRRRRRLLPLLLSVGRTAERAQNRGRFDRFFAVHFSRNKKKK
jgi:hypothetical protein